MWSGRDDILYFTFSYFQNAPKVQIVASDYFLLIFVNISWMCFQEASSKNTSS